MTAERGGVLTTGSGLGRAWGGGPLCLVRAGRGDMKAVDLVGGPLSIPPSLLHELDHL